MQSTQSQRLSGLEERSGFFVSHLAAGLFNGEILLFFLAVRFRGERRRLLRVKDDPAGEAVYYDAAGAVEILFLFVRRVDLRVVFVDLRHNAVEPHSEELRIV